jgi:hypothetical protein
MLGEALRVGLVFPKLRYVEQLTTKSDRELSGYRLDWTRVEEKDRKVWSEHARKGALYIPSLPPEFESLVEGPFAISKEYHDEIVRNAQRGREEWMRDRPFDTAIREMCLETAQAHVEVAFKLLADCHYDLEARYWSRSNKRILESALLWKMWYWQTGRAHVPERALFPRLEETVGRFANVTPDPIVSEINAYLKKMREHDDALCEAFYPDQEPVEGPVIE